MIRYSDLVRRCNTDAFALGLENPHIVPSASGISSVVFLAVRTDGLERRVKSLPEAWGAVMTPKIGHIVSDTGITCRPSRPSGTGLQCWQLIIQDIIDPILHDSEEAGTQMCN